MRSTTHRGCARSSSAETGRATRYGVKHPLARTRHPPGVVSDTSEVMNAATATIRPQVESRVKARTFRLVERIVADRRLAFGMARRPKPLSGKHFACSELRNGLVAPVPGAFFIRVAVVCGGFYLNSS